MLVQEGYTDINDALATLLISHGSSSSSSSSNHSSEEEGAAVWAALRYVKRRIQEGARGREVHEEGEILRGIGQMGEMTPLPKNWQGKCAKIPTLLPPFLLPFYSPLKSNDIASPLPSVPP